ncbi:hypothetical protein [Methanosphaera sp.]
MDEYKSLKKEVKYNNTSIKITLMNPLISIKKDLMKIKTLLNIIRDYFKN